MNQSARFTIPATEFIETHRDTACRVDWLASLSEAAHLVLNGDSLSDERQRRTIALDVLAALKFLSQDLSKTVVQLSDQAESAAWSAARAPQQVAAA